MPEKSPSENSSAQRTAAQSSAAQSSVVADLRGRTGLQLAYFRTWHDRATNPERPHSFADLPAEVDLAFVFPDFTPPDSPFWTALVREYVPALHARGTAVVRTVDISALLDPRFPDTPEGHRQNAEHLVETAVRAHGLDGLDVDMERHLDADRTARAVGVLRELGRLIGRASGTDTLLIYDTNLDGDEPVFTQTADLFDLVLVQSYGRDVDSLQGTWETFAPHLEAARYLIGFSFYEEFDRNRWDDTSEPFADSRAAAYARWQPAGDSKGGVFSFAIDRDGVRLGDDRILPTDYSWTRRIGELLRTADEQGR